MNKYYTTLLLFIGALTTSPIAAETPENIEIGQDAFTPKKKKLTNGQIAGISAGSVVGLILIGLTVWKGYLAKTKQAKFFSLDFWGKKKIEYRAVDSDTLIN